MHSQEAALQFIVNGLISSNENFFFCKTRDQSVTRLPKWMSTFESYGLSRNSAAILTAVIGELTNNSFDHNLGRWHEPSGCAVTFEKESDHLALFVMDRGQGIISSLSSSLKGDFTPTDILRKAFEERVSGRAPEKRGNGLKFVLKHIHQSNNSLRCYSQASVYSTGNSTASIKTSELPKDFGTFVFIDWRLK